MLRGFIFAFVTLVVFGLINELLALCLAAMAFWYGWKRA